MMQEIDILKSIKHTDENKAISLYRSMEKSERHHAYHIDGFCDHSKRRRSNSEAAGDFASLNNRFKAYLRKHVWRC